MSMIADIGKAAAERFMPVWVKNRAEIKFWQGRYAAESGNLSNGHYRTYYTDFFGLSPSDYAGKRVLDIGCGPRGSLEWTSAVAECVGLDPLVPQYRKLGIDTHRMRYVHAGAEKIPFPDAHFDIVASFNNLDHVDDADAAIAEIKRVTKGGGLFLLITEVEHEPSATEPQSLPRNVAHLFEPEFEVMNATLCGIGEDHDVYRSISARLPFVEGEEGIVCAKLRRR